jgi:subtilisin family serine protease
MSRKSTFLFFVIHLTVFSPGWAAELPYRPGELLVRFAPKPDSSQRTIAECNAVLASIGGGTVKHSYKLVSGLTLVKLPENLSVENALVIFKNVNGILYAEPNYKIYFDSTFPDDTRFDELWGMHNTGQTGGTEDADIDAPEAWDIATDSDVIVAVIDSGVDYDHIDLANNMWVNVAELNGDPDVDDDDNDYVDDIYGWNFGDTGTPPGPGPDPNDNHGHGTHVAGTIGAVGNNEEGVVGVCWNVKMMALNTHFDPTDWDAFCSAAIEAIDYAVDNGAGVLNAS